jgi:hypothetical protein
MLQQGNSIIFLSIVHGLKSVIHLLDVPSELGVFSNEFRRAFGADAPQQPLRLTPVEAPDGVVSEVVLKKSVLQLCSFFLAKITNKKIVVSDFLIFSFGVKRKLDRR